MAYNFKQEMQKPERLVGGHRMCEGCGAPPAVRAVLRALGEDEKAVIGCATGCLEVSTFMYPYTSWTDSFIHNAFENTSASVSGAEAAYRALKKRGKVEDDYKFIAFGGDGGTYDIGFQSLSGAMERGTDMVYVCYDNGAYMNTGIQRSSGTPKYADTTTTPVGKESKGKQEYRKDLSKVMVEHGIPYVGQTTLFKNFKDLHEKADKAIHKEGPAFLNILAPCPRGWRYSSQFLMEICKLAVETCAWPMYEVEDGIWRLTYKPKEKLPIEEYLRPQGRFRHLFRPEQREILDEIQKEIDKDWDDLLRRCNEID